MSRNAFQLTRLLSESAISSAWNNCRGVSCTGMYFLSPDTMTGPGLPAFDWMIVVLVAPSVAGLGKKYLVQFKTHMTN